MKQKFTATFLAYYTHPLGLLEDYKGKSDGLENKAHNT